MKVDYLINNKGQKSLCFVKKLFKDDERKQDIKIKHSRNKNIV